MRLRMLKVCRRPLALHGGVPMTQSEWLLIQAVPGAMQSPADTTTRMDGSRWARGHGRVHGIIAGGIWLAGGIYALWLAARGGSGERRVGEEGRSRGVPGH